MRMTDTTPDSSHTNAYRNIVILTLIWGSSFLLNGLALGAFTPLQITFLRLSFGALSITPILLITGQARRLNHVDWAWLVAFSLCGQVLPLLALAWSQQYLVSGLAAVIFSIIPLFVLLLAKPILNQRITKRKWTGFTIGFFGLLILIGPAALDSPGITLIAQLTLLSSCALYAFSTIMLKRMPQIPPLQITTISLALGAILSPLGIISAIKACQRVVISSTQISDLAPIGAILILGVILSGVGQHLEP